MNQAQIRDYIFNLKSFMALGVAPSGEPLDWEQYLSINHEIKHFENHLRLINSTRFKRDSFGNLKPKFTEIKRESKQWEQTENSGGKSMKLEYSDNSESAY